MGGRVLWRLRVELTALLGGELVRRLLLGGSGLQLSGGTTTAARCVGGAPS